MDDRTHQGQDRTSRRAILAAAAGGVGAWIAGAVGRAAPVKAADGAVVEVGESHTGTKTTSFTVSTDSYSALWGNATGGGSAVGVRGDSSSTSLGAAGVWGNGAEIGVRGTGDLGVKGEGLTGVTGIGQNTGVYGFSSAGVGVAANTDTGRAAVHGLAGGTGSGVLGSSYEDATGVCGVSRSYVGQYGAGEYPRKPKTGVYGEALQNASSRGVWGNTGTGQGVRGDASTGVGVSGNASGAAGYAFRGSGRVRFDKVSGVATIPAGATSVTVTPGVDVTGDTFVLLTAKANIGSRSLYYSTDATNNRITIRISSSRPSSTPVGWLLMR